MQPTTLSRINSQSTSGRTLVGSDNGLASPWDSIGSPIIQTPDQKQWIDLDLLNPKFLKGLSAYAPLTKDEPESKLGKGAAKIKAWARQSKAGIDIRLRRKINAEKDEITDIRLVPDAYNPLSDWEKRPILQELPDTSGITELADTSVSTELDATQPEQPSRSSTASTVGEPLPVYEREPGVPYSALDNSNGHPQESDVTPDTSEPGPGARDVSPVREVSIRHRPSVSQSSIVATPTRGLSLRDSTGSDSAGGHTKQGSEDYATFLQADLEQAKKKLDEERELSQSLQAIIQALNEETSLAKASGSDAAQSKASSSLNRLKVAKRTTYETETEHEAPSPARRQRKPADHAGRKKSAPFTKQRLNARKSPAPDAPESDTSESELDAAAGTLIRKQTLPKRVSTTAGSEAVWRSLLRMQTILLGPDHPLTVQAKEDLRATKAKMTTMATANLAALRRSRSIAVRDFGSDHPWVAAFCEDLEKLASLASSEKHQSGSTTKREENEATDAKSTVLDNPVVRDVSPSVAVTASPPRLVTDEPSTPAAQARNPLHLDTFIQQGVTHKEPSPTVGGLEADPQLDLIWNNGRLPHKPQNNHTAFLRLASTGIARLTWNGLQWIMNKYGPEQPVESGKTRVRWTCSCGQQVHDDFVEKRPGAARALEAYLNTRRGVASSPRATRSLQAPSHAVPNDTGSSPTTAGSSPGGRSFGSSFGAPPSSQTSNSNNSFPNGNSWVNGDDAKMQQTWTSMPAQMPYSPTYEPPWLLTCALEEKYTPKVTHLDMSRHKIHSDKDLANALREHYFNVNKKWWKSLRLRGLTTIEFVQFEVHQNRFADIRKVPDIPLKGRPDYSFEASDLLPPVGSNYLLHLFKHPEDYDGELITYLRAPKKHGRLTLGQGWGISLVESFMADKVWLWMSAMFALGSLIFGVAYAVKKQDIQGAFGVAAWVVTLGMLAAGWLQACLG